MNETLITPFNILDELVVKLFKFSFYAFFTGLRELSDGEWKFIKPLLPPRTRVDGFAQPKTT
ncbi:MAG: hypothetical protein QXK12_00380 [Candidatus Nezhaarchaeales archaeon]